MNAIRMCAGGILVLCAVTLSATGCASHVAGKSHEEEQRRVAANLANFADLDLNVYTHQKWDEVHRSHSKDVIVHWPDGRITKGIEPHIEDMKWTFAWAPDTRIKLQPVKVGQGDWTAVVGEMEGTFTRPMPMPDGTSIPPTGKAYKIRLATFAHWTKEGPMDEEYLFWDNQDFMRQIGVGK